jgi:hypothetical protein
MARKAIRYTAKKVIDEELNDDVETQCERWINAFLDEHLPDIDPDVLLAVTPNADIWLKLLVPADAAVAAFQADVWAALVRPGVPRAAEDR